MLSKIITVFFLFLFCPQFLLGAEHYESLRKSDPVGFLTLHNQHLLNARLFKILQYRLSDLSQCRQGLADKWHHLRSKPSMPTDNLSDSTDKLDAVLNLYLETTQQSGSCIEQLERNELNFTNWERQKFKTFHGALDKICGNEKDQRSCRWPLTQVLSDLDPYCVSVQITNFGGNTDPFPCMMGDHLIGRQLINSGNWIEFVDEIAEYISAIRENLKNTPSNGSIDLWSIYLSLHGNRGDQAQLRERFLGVLNFFYSSSQATSSYIRGIHDHLWRTVLRESKSAATTRQMFIQARIQINEMIALDKWMAQQQINRSFDKIPMTKKNRHNYMAGYLACHYRKHSFLIKESLPIALGYAYEALDFKSHMINEKLGFKISQENFRQDTLRYRTSVEWGARFCR